MRVPDEVVVGGSCGGERGDVEEEGGCGCGEVVKDGEDGGSAEDGGEGGVGSGEGGVDGSERTWDELWTISE